MNKVWTGIIVLLCSLTPASAENAYEVAEWAPPDSVAVIAWSGADAARPQFEQSALGQLWNEPFIHKFAGEMGRNFYSITTQSFIHARNATQKALAQADGKTLDETQIQSRSLESVETMTHFLYTLWNQPVLWCVFPTEPSEEWPHEIGWALVGRIDDQYPDVLPQLITTSLKEDEDESIEVEIGGETFTHISGRGQLYIGQVGDRWILGGGQTAIENLLTNWQAKRTFAGHPLYVQTREQFKLKDPLLFNVFHTSEFIKQLLAIAKTEQSRKGSSPLASDFGELPYIGMAAGMLISGFNMGTEHTAAAAGFEGPFLRTCSSSKKNEQHPLFFDFINSRPMDWKWVESVPFNAYSFYCITADWSDMYHQTINTIEHYRQELDEGNDLTDEADTDDNLKQEIIDKLGFDPDKELLAYLGPHVLIYSVPGLGLPSYYMIIEVRDAPGLQERLDVLLEKIPESIVTFDTETVGQATLHILRSEALGMVEMPVLAPCWTLYKDKLVLCSNSRAVSQLLKAWQTPGSDIPSVLEKDSIIEIKEELADLKISSLNWSDEKAIAQLYYNNIAMLYPMMSQKMSEQYPEFNFPPMPPANTLLQHLGQSVGWSHLQGDLRLRESRAHIPVNDVSATVGTTATVTAVLLPSLARARELSKRTVCSANLKGIGIGCFTYAEENDGHFPPDLETLIEIGASTPEAFICPSSGLRQSERVTPDSLKDLKSSYIYIPGHTNDCPPDTVLIYEKFDNHDGEGINILFGDSHVEFIKDMDHARELIEQSRAATQPAAGQPEEN